MCTCMQRPQPPLALLCRPSAAALPPTKAPHERLQVRGQGSGGGQVHCPHRLSIHEVAAVAGPAARAFCVPDIASGTLGPSCRRRRERGYHLLCLTPLES